MCRNDHMEEAFVHSQDRGCFVHTVRKSETMHGALAVVVTQDHGSAGSAVRIQTHKSSAEDATERLVSTGTALLERSDSPCELY